MQFLIKILFSIFAIFQINISEASVVVFESTFSETIFSSTLYSEKSRIELEDLFSENELGNTCKNESNLVYYRNLVSVAKTTAAKTGFVQYFEPDSLPCKTLDGD